MMSVNDSLTILDLVQDVVDQFSAVFHDGTHFVSTEISPGTYTIILADYQYWTESHYDELEQWAQRHDGLVSVSGMTVQILDPKLMLEFTLRWS